MTPDLYVLLSVFLIMVVLFTFEILPLEVTALLGTGILLLFDVLTVDEALSGFSNKAVITIGAMFILGRSLVKTGFLEVFADFIYSKVGQNKWLTIITFFALVSLFSGLINNTAAVAIFIPLAINLCQRFHISPTKLLLPLSYAAIIGGMLTLIGTSTNLIVSSFMGEHNMIPLSMFEFTKLGLIFLVIGIIYNILIARFILPSRAIVSSLTQKYHIGTYLTEFRVNSSSPIVGKRLNSFDLSEKYQLDVIKVMRGETSYSMNLSNLIIEENDVFIVQINIKNLVKLKNELNVSLLTDIKMSQEELIDSNHVLVEAIVTQQSDLIGNTIFDFNFKRKFSGFVLAIKRQQELLRDKVAHVRLRFSDTLLIMIAKEKLSQLRQSMDLIVMEELDIHLRYERYWWMSILIIPIIMILSSFGVFSIVKGAVLGTILLLALKSLSMQDAYESINWSVIFLIAGLVPIGVAISKTGADFYIGQMIILCSEYFGANSNPEVYISVLYFFTFILSAFISNAAVAVILCPIALFISQNIGIDARPLLITICFGASASFITPMGYQTNLMVYAPGQYKVKDFIYVGIPLTFIFWYIATLYIPYFWPI